MADTVRPHLLLAALGLSAVVAGASRTLLGWVTKADMLSVGATARDANPTGAAAFVLASGLGCLVLLRARGSRASDLLVAGAAVPSLLAFAATVWPWPGLLATLWLSWILPVLVGAVAIARVRPDEERWLPGLPFLYLCGRLLAEPLVGRLVARMSPDSTRMVVSAALGLVVVGGCVLRARAGKLTRSAAQRAPTAAAALAALVGLGLAQVIAGSLGRDWAGTPRLSPSVVALVVVGVSGAITISLCRIDGRRGLLLIAALGAAAPLIVALLERVGALPSFAGALIQGAMVPVFQGAMLRLFWTRPNGAAEYGVLAIVAPLMGSLLLG
ncbi:MAG: hypothetical protein IPM79_24940 [Polyangiaceae bacterium]|jgi:hypothetical protein|nr:hypothetical protein [Polyangiaceae bacterium]MBK8940773.1 hypothetical protein [Polyangiaceae bacterium]